MKLSTLLQSFSELAGKRSQQTNRPGPNTCNIDDKGLISILCKQLLQTNQGRELTKGKAQRLITNQAKDDRAQNIKDIQPV